MSKILVKQATPQMAATMGSGGPGISFLLGGGKMKTPKELEEAGFGKIGSPSHDFAMDNQRRGHMLRYGLAGLGAFNAAYNQTSSGQPGVIGAAAQGATSGYYGSQGLEDFAARAGRRFGGRNLSTGVPVNTTALVPTKVASPTQKEPIDVEFTEEEHDDEQRLLAPPTANMTSSPIDSAMGNIRGRRMYDRMGEEFGNTSGRRMYDTMGREYGQ